MWAAFVLAWLTAGPTTVSLDQDSPCAPREVLARELRQSPLRLVEGDADLRVRLTFGNTGHRLSVRTADGVVVLERVLPTTSCSEAGGAAALILDRSVRDIIVRLPDAGVARETATREVTPATKDTGTKDTGTKSTGTKDTATKDTATKDTATKDTATKDTATKDTATKDTATKDTETKDTATKDTETKDTATKDTAKRETGTRGKTAGDTATRSPPTRDATTRDASARDTSAPDTTARDTPRDTTARDTSARETTGRDTPRDSAARDSAARDTAARDTTERDTPRARDTTRDTATRDTATRDTATRDTATRDTAARDTATRDTATRDTTRDTATRDMTARDTSPAEPTPPTAPRSPTRLNPPPPVAEPTPALPASAPVPTPATSRPQLSPPARPAPPQLDAARLLTPRPLRFEFTGGGGIAFPTPATVSALFSVDAALQVGTWRAGLLGAFSLGGSTQVTDETGRARGTLSAQTLYLLPHAMACSDTTVQFCGGLRAGARLDIGSAAGPLLFQIRPGLAVAPSAGLAGRVAMTLGPVLIAIDATFLVNLLTPSLSLQGLTARIETPRVELLINLSGGLRGQPPTPSPTAPSQ